ncbi:hypothetical protein P4O66_002395 [Electrophorus voltai]|uniref:Glypican-1 n=1 Tax=Electrophorus voltai TaxID=2609070 RepID=A0AAD8YZZ6_9TELE|nr:hypothetical protein P4O66_002395 [Electrophorus voltai]
MLNGVTASRSRATSKTAQGHGGEHLRVCRQGYTCCTSQMEENLSSLSRKEFEDQVKESGRNLQASLNGQYKSFDVVAILALSKKIPQKKPGICPSLATLLWFPVCVPASAFCLCNVSGGRNEKSSLGVRAGARAAWQREFRNTSSPFTLISAQLTPARGLEPTTLLARVRCTPREILQHLAA